MWRIPSAPPGFFPLGKSLHGSEVVGVYFSTVVTNDFDGHTVWQNRDAEMAMAMPHLA